MTTKTQTQLVIQKGVTSDAIKYKWYDWNVIEDASEDSVAECRTMIKLYTEAYPYLKLKIIQRTTTIVEVDIL